MYVKTVSNSSTKTSVHSLVSYDHAHASAYAALTLLQFLLTRAAGHLLILLTHLKQAYATDGFAYARPL